MLIKLDNEINLPWVEKYRPNKLEELISHEDIILTINKFLEDGKLPHLLLYGPPGTGKTSTILAIAKKLYTPKEFSTMVLELNASDDRGIGIVREQILNFAATKSIFKIGFKLIILDEADAMTTDAQNALRRIIEKYTENARFCLVCNYLSKIIPALQSRCTRFRFGPLNSKQIIPRLTCIIEKENLNVEESGKKALIDLSRGDMRKVLNILQSTSMAHNIINEDTVYTCCGQPKKEDIQKIVDSLVSCSFNEIHKNLQKMKHDKGIALQDIITQVHLMVQKINFPYKIKLNIIEKLSDVEYQLLCGGSEKLQLSAFIGIFQEARDYNH